jgi:hypothetical protein
VTQILCYFVKSVFSDSKFCPTPLETVGLRVLNRKFRGCSPFNFDFEVLNCPSARYLSGANAIDSDIDKFNASRFRLIID